MSGYITDDTCEDVTICTEKPIVQDCLPEGEDLHCLYTIDLEVPDELKKCYYNADHVEQIWAKYGHDFRNVYDDVQFLLNKVVTTGPNGIQQERWLAEADGGWGNDMLSGKGLLNYLNADTGGSGAVAQFNPSVYLGDLIHFDLDGGDGNDFVEGANNADILAGGKGEDCIVGWGGDDNISGGDGDDKIYGDDGNDIIDAGKGNDKVWGGNGADDLTGGDGKDTLYGDAGNDNLRGGEGSDELWGGDGDDWSAGGAGDDVFVSGAGNDCADGGEGNDSMDMGDGDDRALGGAGDDTMRGGAGNDKLDGGIGNDKVYGDDGNDLVDGGDGDDLVFGGKGDDIVRGGLGEDEMTGGAGCDIFAFCEVDLNCGDYITDFDTGLNADQIDLSNVDGLDMVKVVLTTQRDTIRLHLFDEDGGMQEIFVKSVDGGNLRAVFETDTAYGTDVTDLVKVGSGVMVDLPSTSVIFSDGDGLFL